MACYGKALPLPNTLKNVYAILKPIKTVFEITLLMKKSISRFFQQHNQHLDAIKGG